MKARTKLGNLDSKQPGAIVALSNEALVLVSGGVTTSSWNYWTSTNSAGGVTKHWFQSYDSL
jgi:hypothetical protein